MLLEAILLLQAFSWHGPKRVDGKCPEGYVYAGGIATSDAVYTPGCYTPKEKKKADEWFDKMWCGEMGEAEFGGDYIHERNSDWKNGKCVQSEKWQVRKNGKWVEITKEEYMRGTCEQEWIDSVQVYPKPEWKECQKEDK
jgi:hypothetical protein